MQLIPNLLPTERYSVFYENCVSLYLSHLFISSEARKSAPKKLAIGPRPWSVVGGNFIYGSLWIAGQRYEGGLRMLGFFHFQMKNKMFDNGLAFS